MKGIVTGNNGKFLDLSFFLVVCGSSQHVVFPLPSIVLTFNVQRNHNMVYITNVFGVHVISRARFS